VCEEGRSGWCSRAPLPTAAPPRAHTRRRLCLLLAHPHTSSACVLLCKQEVRQHLYVCTSKAGKVRTCKRNQELHRYYLYFCTRKAAGKIKYLQAPAGRPPRRCVEEQRMECSACSPCRWQLVPEILHEPDFFIFVQEVGGGSGGGGGKLLAHKRCAGGSTSCYVQVRYAVATSAYVSIRQHTSAYCQHTVSIHVSIL
jgi:hypothetical protein